MRVLLFISLLAYAAAIECSSYNNEEWELLTTPVGFDPYATGNYLDNDKCQLTYDAETFGCTAHIARVSEVLTHALQNAWCFESARREQTVYWQDTSNPALTNLKISYNQMLRRVLHANSQPCGAAGSADQTYKDAAFLFHQMHCDPELSDGMWTPNVGMYPIVTTDCYENEISTTQDCFKKNSATLVPYAEDEYCGCATSGAKVTDEQMKFNVSSVHVSMTVDMPTLTKAIDDFGGIFLKTVTTTAGDDSIDNHGATSNRWIWNDGTGNCFEGTGKIRYWFCPGHQKHKQGTTQRVFLLCYVPEKTETGGSSEYGFAHSGSSYGAGFAWISDDSGLNNIIKEWGYYEVDQTLQGGTVTW